MRRTIAIIAAALTLGTASTAVAAEPAPLPTLTQSFAIAYTVNAIDARADTFPGDLAVTCKRTTRTVFRCAAKWAEAGDLPADRLTASGHMTIWLQRHSSAGEVFWHYRGLFLLRNRAGRVVGRYVWK